MFHRKIVITSYLGAVQLLSNELSKLST